MTAETADAGLRERKKQRTRTALIDAAFELFARKGFDATTVDEIAAAVDVSPRTFFRYFTSKEEVALTQLDEQRRVLLALLAARPADEPALTALHRAMKEVIAGCETGANGFQPARFKHLQRLIAASPALAAHSLEQDVVGLAEVARVIAGRMGVDPVTDPRPYLVASVGICAVQSAVNGWREGDRRSTSSDLVDQAFRLIADGLDYPSAID